MRTVLGAVCHLICKMKMKVIYTSKQYIKSQQLQPADITWLFLLQGNQMDGADLELEAH